MDTTSGRCIGPEVLCGTGTASIALSQTGPWVRLVALSVTLSFITTSTFQEKRKRKLVKRLIKKRYREHKWNAECRGIEFCLTFEEWIAIWLESGHLDERGCRSGCYVMARHDDKGPYKVGKIGRAHV